ncbi:MAG: hypothetical protein H6Q19_11 [Bacteroidetes bacterium]|nr:hypothetical protein [Bacteroidota bacterium]
MFVIKSIIIYIAMKKPIIFILTLALLTGCIGTPQQKAEYNVKKYIKEMNSKEQTDLKPVSAGKLQTIELKEDSAYLAARDSMFYYKRKLSETFDQFKLADNQNKAQDFISEMKLREKFCEERKYKIVERVKSEAKGEYDITFFLDGNLEVVE